MFRTRRFFLLLVGVVVAMVAAACGSSADKSGGGEAQTWTVGVMPCSSDCGFLQMAQDKGFYKKQGVDVKFVTLNSASQIYPALAAGEVDAIQQSPGGLMIAQQKGGLDAKIIGSSMQGMPYAIYAQKQFTKLSQLEGKSMAISSPIGLPALVAQLILQDAGVPWKSIKPVNAGGNADRYKAVVAGTADAASSPADYVPQAKKDGVNVLALSMDVIPKYPRYMIIARSESLKNKGDLATKYMAGLIEGLRYALDHPDEQMAISAKALKTTADDPMVTYMQKLVTSKKLIDPNGGIDMDMVKFQEKVLRDSGQLTKDLDVTTLVDDSYQQAALKLLDNKS